MVTVNSMLLAAAVGPCAVPSNRFEAPRASVSLLVQNGFMNSDDTTLPENMRDLPVDTRRGLPVPVMNVLDDGSNDFTVTNTQWVIGHPQDCGICGKPLGYWMAFVGGPKSTLNRSYLDPPFHEECAEAAMRLCPHMAIERHERAPEHRVNKDAIAPDGFIADKPDAMFIAITRGFKIGSLQGAPYFKAAPPRRVREFRYLDGVLTERV